jgi:tRNA(Ile2)-agmatinylcytidine synthase
MFIGVDDTDSEKGLCTTYLAAVLMERLSTLGEIRGLPKLIRLNPCVQFKTRGNAALAFQLETDLPEQARELALEVVLELSDLSGENTNPGLVMADEIYPEMKEFYRRAATEILAVEEAREILERRGIWHKGLKKGRGLIGALAAIGADPQDYTYELIAYRERQRWGTLRSIDAESVWEADLLTYPRTWDTVDHGNRRIVFAPHSADPVLFGIRGGEIEAIQQAFSLIKSIQDQSGDGCPHLGGRDERAAREPELPPEGNGSGYASSHRRRAPLLLPSAGQGYNDLLRL